jgi:hypothetical protein
VADDSSSSWADPAICLHDYLQIGTAVARHTVSTHATAPLLQHAHCGLHMCAVSSQRCVAKWGECNVKAVRFVALAAQGPAGCQL